MPDHAPLPRRALRTILKALPPGIHALQDTGEMAACLGIAAFAGSVGLDCHAIHVTCASRAVPVLTEPGEIVEFSFTHLRCRGLALDLHGHAGTRAVRAAALANVGHLPRALRLLDLPQAFASRRLPGDLRGLLDEEEARAATTLAAQVQAVAAAIMAAGDAGRQLASAPARKPRRRA